MTSRPPRSRNIIPTHELIVGALRESQGSMVSSAGVAVDLAEFCDSGLGHLEVAVLIVDAAGNVRYMNDVAERLTGWTNHDAVGGFVEDIFPLRREEHDFDIPLLPTVAEDPFDAATGRRTCFLVRKNGERLAVRVAVSPTRGPDGWVNGVALVVQNVSEQRLMTLRLAHQVTHDTLTGLLNRQGIIDPIAATLNRVDSHGEHAVLCYLDFEQLALVNDTCGHEAGDHMLEWIAAQLLENIAPGDAAARVGGAEFAVLLEGKSAHEAQRMAEGLLHTLRKVRFVWEDKTFAIAGTAGLVPLTSQYMGPVDLLSAGHQGATLAKQQGSGGVYVYEWDAQELSGRRRANEWIAAIKHNLQENRVRLFAQTIRPLDGDVSGLHCEILFRMISEDGKVQPIGGVVEAAERYGLMSTIDRWVIKHTLQQLAALGPQALKKLDLCCINLSGTSLRSDSLVEYLREELGRSGVPPEKICFEVTETAAVQNLERARHLMRRITDLGCRLAIDDFGVGMASYSYLRDLPVHFLKIDGTFVKDMANNTLNRAIIQSINDISHMLGMQTVAEWVETESAVEHLKRIGVDYAQGYLFSRPLPFEEMTALALA